MNVKELLNKYSREVFKVIKECPGTKFVTLDRDGFLCCWADDNVQFDDRVFEWEINDEIDCGGGWIFEDYHPFKMDLKSVEDFGKAVIKVSDLGE